MSFSNMLNDSIVIVAADGTRSAPTKASVQSEKIFVFDMQAEIQEGYKILRTLPNGREESYTVLQADFHEAPNRRMSHFEIKVRKDTSLVPASKAMTINIHNSHGFQIGDRNTQQIVDSVAALANVIDSADAPEPIKAEAKSKLQGFVKHPLIVSLLGAAAKTVFDKI